MQVYFNYGGDTFGPYPAAQALEIARSDALPEDARIYLPPATWGDVAVFLAGAEAGLAPHDPEAAATPPPPVVVPTPPEPDPWAAMSQEPAPTEAPSPAPPEPVAELAAEPKSSDSRLWPILLGVVGAIATGAGAYLTTLTILGYGVAAVGALAVVAAIVWLVRSPKPAVEVSRPAAPEPAQPSIPQLPAAAVVPSQPTSREPVEQPPTQAPDPGAAVAADAPAASGPSTLLVVLLAVLCLVLALGGAYLVISGTVLGYALIALGLMGVTGLLLWLRRARA